MRHASVFVLQPKTTQINTMEAVFVRGVNTVCGGFVDKFMLF